MAIIVLVVAATGSLTSGDTVLQGRIVAAGHTVVLRNDEDAEYTGSYDGVVVSDSSSGGTVGAKYDTVAKPAITCENTTWRLGTYLGAISGTQWTLQSVAGNGGLTGTQTVYSSSQSQQGIDTDILPAAATVVARLLGDADHGTYVTYASGGALTSGTAPAKRVFLRIGDAAMASLASAGTALVDAALAWAFPTSTTYTKTGGAAAQSAGSGTQSVIPANFINRTGGGAARCAGSGTRIVTVPRLRTGGAAARAAGSGAVSVINVPPDQLPSDVLDLSYWHLTTPEDSGDGDAEQINQPALDDFESDGFFVDEDGFVTCIAPVDGFTTSGASGAVRMELRQHNKVGYANAAMDPTSGNRWQMTITTSADPTSITGGSNPRQELIIAQIHGAGDSPIPLILSAEWTSGGNPVTPRVRIFKNGPGLANIITGITTSTRLTFRIRIGSSRLKVWGVVGEKEDLPPITTSTTYDWPISDFTDQEGWYYKCGAYHKTTIASGSSGLGIARISYLNVLEPGDPEESFPVTYEKSGGGAARGAGSGARTLSSAIVHAKTGGAAGLSAGSGTRTVTSTIHARTGGAACAAAGSGARTLTPGTTHTKTGGAAASTAGSGARVLSSAAVHTRTGGSAVLGAGNGEVEHESPESYDRAGGGAASVAGSGTRLVSHAYDVTGGGVLSAAGSGAQDITPATTYDLSGGAAAVGAGDGVLQTGGGVTYARTGGGSVSAAGSGARTTQSADIHARAGGAAAAVAGSGAGDVQSAVVRTRAGAASASAAGSGPAEHVPAVRHDRAGGGAVSAVGAGTSELVATVVHARTGGAAAGGAGAGDAAVVGATVHVRTGGGAVTGAGIALVEVIPATVHARAGGGVLVGAGAARRRVGGRMRAGVPVAAGQFRSGTPVRR